TTHVRIARDPADIHAVRIAAGEADLVLGCDMVVVNDYWALSKIRAQRSHVVLNTYQAMPGTFTMHPDMNFPADGIVNAVRLALAGEEPMRIDATALATALMGDSIASNLFMLGYAWQMGLVPISFDALMRAIELNGAAVAMNQRAFAWGRLAAIDPAAVAEAAGQQPARPETGDADTALKPALEDSLVSQSLDETIARREAFLTDYQNAAHAARYRALVDRTRAAEANRAPGSTALTEAVARYAFKLMAYKDEYEVARLYTSGEFQRRIEQQFEGDYRLHFNLAPPLFSRRDSEGHLVKREYGPWVFTAFKLLARLKGLRGSVFDPFGYTAERREERRLIEEYFTTIEQLLAGLNGDNHALAVEIASVPEHIRGFGHVKEAHLAKARQQR
ncbi:MAG: indolepyruvate ferredoxin oxidoreductase, partial [Gammaproteobacteria bacterium HGW-Gammaproteobacteria-7]